MAIAVQPQQLPSRSVINSTWVTKLVINQRPPKEVLVFVSLANETKNNYSSASKVDFKSCMSSQVMHQPYPHKKSLGLCRIDAYFVVIKRLVHPYFYFIDALFC